MVRTLKGIGRRLATESVFGAQLLLRYHQLRRLALARLTDEEFAQHSYRKFAGVSLDLRHPQTFDERLWWLKLNYRNPLMTQCSDKVTVRDYATGLGLSPFLAPLIGVYSDPSEIRWDELPEQFYIKTNHSSGTNIRCDDSSHFDRKRATRLLKTYLKRDHYSLSREWNYKGIEPRIMVEPVLESSDPNGLVDYRFLCSYGKCHGVLAAVDMADEEGRHNGDGRQNLYDRDWNLLPVKVTRDTLANRVIERPAMLETMIDIAEKLSAPFPFCRVDLYNPDSRTVYLGEMTFFHMGGNNRIEPSEFAYEMGSWIDLPRAITEVNTGRYDILGGAESG